jgi:HlyD family secretion protein
MRVTITAAPLLLTSMMFGQPIVQRDAIWIEKVQRGDMPVSVRARGVLTSDKTAELKVPELLAKPVQLGQAVSIDAPPLRVNGRVSRIGPEVNNGEVPVLVELTLTLPDSVRAGSEVDGMIQVTTLTNVAYVGRPMSCRPDGEGVLFKLEPGGQSATRVKVRYGQFGHTPAKVVEIREGLMPGDQVILSDMSAQSDQERVRLQ